MTKQNINYDFFYNQTNHPLIQKYFDLRAREFTDQWGLKNFDGSEDIYDKHSIILIAHKDGECLGGTRLAIKYKDNINKLPFETEDFKVKDLFPKLNLENKKYAEISRAVLVKKLRDRKHISKMCDLLVRQKATELGIQYIFCVSAELVSRSFRMTYKSLGLSFEVQKHITVPELPTYEGHKMVLSLIDLTNANSTKYQERLKIKDTVW